MKINMGYLRVTSQTIDAAERQSKMSEAAKKFGGIRLLCDIQERHGWHLREAWDVIRGGVVCGRIGKLFLWDIYCIDYNHSNIIEFIEMCKKRDVKLHFVGMPEFNNFTDAQNEAMLLMLKVVAKRLKQYRANQQYGNSSRAQRPPLPETVREQIINNVRDGLTVKEIHDQLRWVRDGRECKIGMSTIYRERKKYLDNLKELADE
jgi:hypothetical protein